MDGRASPRQGRPDQLDRGTCRAAPNTDMNCLSASAVVSTRRSFGFILLLKAARRPNRLGVRRGGAHLVRTFRAACFRPFQQYSNAYGGPRAVHEDGPRLTPDDRGGSVGGVAQAREGVLDLGGIEGRMVAMT
jgi:hypothetical protein